MRGASRPRANRPPVIRALVSIGTNSTRLLVLADGRTLAAESRGTRLGTGLQATGRLDVAGPGETTKAIADQLKGAVPQMVVIRVGALTSPNLLVNHARPPFNDPRARQAASLLLDRDGYAKLFFGGKGNWDNVINAGMGDFYLDPQGKDIGDTAQWFKLDPQKAKQLLSAAGYSNTEVPYHYSPGYGKVFASQAEAVLAMLKEGFNLKAVPEDYGAYIANTFAGNDLRSIWHDDHMDHDHAMMGEAKSPN